MSGIIGPVLQQSLENFKVFDDVVSNKRFIHSPAEKKARTLRSSAGRVRKLDCGILVRDY